MSDQPSLVAAGVSTARSTGAGRARPPSIGSHRLLSNGRSAALIRPDTEIDWWCAPRFDSPPLLWRLLDSTGATARWRVERPLSTTGEAAGAHATTLVHTGDAAIECRDGLVTVDDGTVALVRLVRAHDGPGRIAHELSFAGLDGTGFDGATVKFDGRQGAIGDHLVTIVGAAPHLERGLLRHEIVADDEWRGFAVVVGSRAVVGLDELAATLDDADRAVSRSQRSAVLPLAHPERARETLRVLEACTYEPTGAVIASPTTSLPEVPGGDRQWDYRFCWLRDAALAVSVAALLGHRHAAERYLAFVCSLSQGKAPRQPVVSIDGGPVPDEREVSGVEGWAGSTPVRVGNAAACQIQHDVHGLILEAVSVYLKTGGIMRRHTWQLVRGIADHVATCPEEHSNGIWEVRDRRRFVSGDIGKWLALERAIAMARVWRPWARRARWKAARDEVRARVLGVLGPDGTIPQTYDGDSRGDAAALMLVVFGLLDRRDPRAAALVDATLKELGADPFVYRYRPDGWDQLTPGEGAFVPMCWWAVSALAIVGRRDEAVTRLDELCARLPQLLAEEFDPVDDVALGNVPLVWAHSELARSLYVVDAERRRARWGTVGLALWRIGHALRLRLRRR